MIYIYLESFNMSSALNITIYHDQVINQFFDVGVNYFQR